MSNGQQAILKPKPLQFGAPVGGFRMPQKYINEMSELKKKADKNEEFNKELFERWTISDRII